MFRRPAGHDETTCPFQPVAKYPRGSVINTLERVARRDPLQVVVTLCHLNASDRQDLWDTLTADTKTRLIPHLEGVHRTSTSRTREYARDIIRHCRIARTV